MSVFKKNSKVIELTPANFINGKVVHPKLEGNKKGLVVFTCLWCGFCKALEKPYSDTAYVMGDSFPLFNVDCVKYADFAQKMGIKSYPTIKYIQRSGKIGREFKGERTVQGFLDDICKESKVCKSQ
jgi:thiol-disulfide isomerase/thioredoxin